MLATMDHTMADAVQFAACGLLGHRQQFFERGTVIGTRNVQALLGVPQLPVHHGFGGAETFGQALQGESGLGFVDQCEFDRRAAAVNHQDVTS